MKIKKTHQPLLVPVDFSGPSESALCFASHIAECIEEPLVVLHVVHDPGAMPGYYSAGLDKKQLRRIEDRAAEMFHQFLMTASKHCPQYKAMEKKTHMVVKGLPVTRILEVANKIHAGQIIMGSQGRTGLKHLMLGSVAEQVVRLSPIPVTVVKETGHKR